MRREEADHLVRVRVRIRVRVRDRVRVRVRLGFGLGLGLRVRVRVRVSASTCGRAQLASPPCTKAATTSSSQPASPPLSLQRSAPAVGARLVAWTVSGDGAARSISAPG